MSTPLLTPLEAARLVHNDCTADWVAAQALRPLTRSERAMFGDGAVDESDLPALKKRWASMSTSSTQTGDTQRRARLTADDIARQIRKPATPNEDALRNAAGGFTGADLARARKRDAELADSIATNLKKGAAATDDPSVARSRAEAHRSRAQAERLVTRTVSPYADERSPYSWFADKALASAGDGQERDAAAQRLDDHRTSLAETRAISTGNLGAFLPGASGLPAWVSAAIAPGARSAAPLFHASQSFPLPPEGVSVPIAQVSTGSTAAAIASENTGISVSSFATTLETEPFATIASANTYSFQAHDRGGATFDMQIAMDMTAAFYTTLETQMISGTGSSGQLRGLDNSSWASTVTTAGQTFANHINAILKAAQLLELAFGQPADLIVMAPRRMAWLRANSTTLPLEAFFPGKTIVSSPPMSTGLGAGSEDWVYVLNTQGPVVFTSAVPDGPEVRVNAQSSANKLQADLEVYAYASYATARRVEAMAVAKGFTVTL